MIIEIDTSILNRIEDLSIDQLVFLNLVKNWKSIKNQDVYSLVSRVNEQEIQDLVKKGLVSVKETEKDLSYELTQTYIDLVLPKLNYFDEFYDEYPVYVTRPDGTKQYLRANVNKCRREYTQIVGRSELMHQHIMKCLRFEKSEKLKYGKMGYMKTMWKWLVNHEWETYDEQISDEQNQSYKSKYGTEIL